MVYTFGTSKGYIEKEQSISLETLARLEKLSCTKKGPQKECQISDMTSFYAKKSKGTALRLDQMIETTEKIEDDNNTDVYPTSIADKKLVEQTIARINNGIMEKFQLKYELTNDPSDFVKSKDIEAWMVSIKDTSYRKFVMELKKYIVIHKLDEVKNKDKRFVVVTKGWSGIKLIVYSDVPAEQ